MFYIIETDSQLNYLEQAVKEGAYVEAIPANDYYHPILNSTIAVYIRPLIANKGFILPINHTDGLNIDKNRVEELLQKSEVIYTYNKKELLYHFFHRNIVDIQLLHTLNEYQPLELPSSPSIIGWYYNMETNFKEVNAVIPLVKLYERCENNYEYLKPKLDKYKDFTKDPSWKFYNDTATGVFFLLEQSGLKVSYNKFVELFTPKNPRFSISNNLVYGSYNLYNITSRPTNSFNSVNLAAIPKKEEHRRSILTKKDTFVEFDFDGYHIRLLADIVGYKLTEESAHTQLGRLYFNKQELTEEEYAKSKQTTFQIIYGGVPDKWRHIEFFDKVHELSQSLWKEFKEKGEVRAPISQKLFTSKLKDMNSNKLMNYILQSMETSRNILIIRDVLKYLQDKKSQVVLYTYDSLLLDFDKSDGKHTLIDLEQILSKDGYPVKFKANTNLVLQ